MCSMQRKSTRLPEVWPQKLCSGWVGARRSNRLMEGSAAEESRRLSSAGCQRTQFTQPACASRTVQAGALPRGCLTSVTAMLLRYKQQAHAAIQTSGRGVLQDKSCSILQQA